MTNQNNMIPINTYHQVSSGCKERYELWYNESQDAFVLREYLDNVFSDWFGDITGEAEILGFSGLFCFDDIKEDMKRYKKALASKTITCGAITLAGKKVSKTMTLDIEIHLFFLRNKNINASAFIQQAIIEKLERDSKTDKQE